MANGDSTGDWGYWRVEDPPFAIQYSRAALEKVRAVAVEGLHKLAKGGLEVGGLLIGERDGDTLRILGSRPIACEHAYGPSFTLSAGDEEALRLQIASLGAAPEITGLIVVGWYHSHTRSELSLSEKDQEVFDRCFPEPWQVSLVLRPNKLGPVRAGFFYRERGRPLRRDSSYREFELEPVRKQPKPEAPPAPHAAPAPPAEAVHPTPAGGRPGPRYWLLFALAWCVSAASLAFALRDYWLPRSASTPGSQAVAQPAPPAPDPAVLELRRQRDALADEVQILQAELDRLTKAPPPRGAKAATPKTPK